MMLVFTYSDSKKSIQKENIVKIGNNKNSIWPNNIDNLKVAKIKFHILFIILSVLDEILQYF